MTTLNSFGGYCDHGVVVDGFCIYERGFEKLGGGIGRGRMVLVRVLVVRLGIALGNFAKKVQDISEGLRQEIEFENMFYGEQGF